MSQPIVAAAGEFAPARLQQIETLLAGAYTVKPYAAQERYVSALADDHAALILVDGTREGWVYWCATPRSSPATRRIPVLLLVDAPDAHPDALTSGVDLRVDIAALDDELPRLVRDYARVFDPERAERLDCECQEPLPDLAEQGFEKFNAGEFYKQHDLFEELWVETEGPVRDLYRAILQVGVAYYQIQRGNPRGALKMLLRSVQWLTVLPDECQGIDVKALRDDSYRVRAELERLGEDRIADFDHALLQPVKKVPGADAG